jgi:hypothetical protein
MIAGLAVTHISRSSWAKRWTCGAARLRAGLGSEPLVAATPDEAASTNAGEQLHASGASEAQIKASEAQIRIIESQVKVVEAQNAALDSVGHL